MHSFNLLEPRNTPWQTTPHALKKILFERLSLRRDLNEASPQDSDGSAVGVFVLPDNRVYLESISHQLFTRRCSLFSTGGTMHRGLITDAP